MYSDRLKRIIELKAKLLQEKEKELEQLSRQHTGIEDDIEANDREINQQYDDLCTRCFSGSEFMVLTDYTTYLKGRGASLLKEKERVEAEIVLLREHLKELLKEIKMLEKLRSKTMASIKKVQDRRYQKTLDAIALRIESRKP